MMEPGPEYWISSEATSKLFEFRCIQLIAPTKLYNTCITDVEQHVLLLAPRCILVGTQQGRRRKPSVKTLRSPVSAES